ncbi:MAG: class I adenylate-forming enzyme family protein [Myxococcota bacterium]|jgi:long-chain acyl-CoA synthetase|nr:class I adenylate-forming enzyme family protein [Myxococcota bacterium]
MNLMMLLEMAAEGMGDRVAVVSGDVRLTYGELFEASGRAAARLRASELDHLAILDTSSPALPVAVFAAAWAGKPFVPLNYRLTGDELDRLLEQILPGQLITDADRVDSLAGRSGLEVIGRGDYLASARAKDAESLEREWSMDPDEIAILLFTSGTTGPPKAAVIRHKHLVSYILMSVEFMSADENDAALVCVPPYHIAGMAAIASSVYAGRRIVQLPNFTPEAWLELARKEQVTNAFVVPTMLARIVELLEGEGSADLPHLRALSYGGGKMPQSVIERALELFPETNFANAYGLTETSSTISILGPEDHRAAIVSDDPKVRRRLVSVGQPLPAIEVEIRDDEGNALGANERGEIYVRGEQVSGEYLGKGSQVQEDGFFPTRDGGSLDEDGYLFIEGRIDDIIVRGGENISPGEIEDVLLKHEAIADAAVVGLPDEQWGEKVVAAVVYKAGDSASEAELQQWVKDRLRSSRTPESFDFWPELPYNETGKLLRRTVRSRLMAG